MTTKATVPYVGINVPTSFHWAGFELTLFGRFWVTPEVGRGANGRCRSDRAGILLLPVGCESKLPKSPIPGMPAPNFGARAGFAVPVPVVTQIV
jgi:hypothetical protein